MLQKLKTKVSITESQILTVGFWSCLFIVLIIADWLTKFLAFHFNWPIFYNQNFAFSLPVPSYLMFTIYAIVLTAATLYLIRFFSRISNFERLAWVMIIASGLSNVLERAWRGSVTDFIFIWTGVFNLADFLIIAGLVVLFFRKRS